MVASPSIHRVRRRFRPLFVEPLEARCIPSFLLAVLYPVSFPAAEAVADFNGDGIPDLAMTSGNGVSIFLGNGDGRRSVANPDTAVRT